MTEKQARKMHKTLQGHVKRLSALKLKYEEKVKNHKGRFAQFQTGPMARAYWAIDDAINRLNAACKDLIFI